MMTKEEAKSILFDMLGDTTIIEPTEQNQAILTAIKALEQEPCNDVISRQAAVDAINALHEKSNAWLDSAVDAVMALPSVTSRPKIGHWIDTFGGCKCSECNCLEAGYSDYCPNCGAQMEEVGE